MASQELEPRHTALGVTLWGVVVCSVWIRGCADMICMRCRRLQKSVVSGKDSN